MYRARKLLFLHFLNRISDSHSQEFKRESLIFEGGEASRADVVPNHDRNVLSLAGPTVLMKLTENCLIYFLLIYWFIK